MTLNLSLFTTVSVSTR